MNKLTVIDFFCGAGGFSEGFRQLGYEVVGGFDHWKPAVDTFNHNFGTFSEVTNILDFKESIKKIDDLPNTDVIIGSPPCVSFSSSNNSGKADKESGILLIKTFLRIIAVKKFQPKSILKAWYMENVANSIKYLADYYTFSDLGLAKWAKSNNLKPNDIAITLKDNQPIINSADYGSFQSRKRAISGEVIKYGKLVIPQPTCSNDPLNKLPKWKSLRSLLNQMPSPIENNQTKTIVDPIYKDIELSIAELTDHFYDSGLYKSEWKQSKYLKSNHPFMGKMAFPENTKKPSRTVTATKSGTSREALVYKSEYNRVGDGEYRSPTIREISSIMGFPYTFQFLGTDNSKWRLVGNAVCPSVSRALGEEILKSLEVSIPKKLYIERSYNENDFNNLNTFCEKGFNKQPRRNKNSRFRRQPFKEGNLTVTLSNYDIVENNKPNNRWFTSIQYGTGNGFPSQIVEDDFYKELEPIILKNKKGKDFLKIINNGFAKKIGSAKELQNYYEMQFSNCSISEPTDLVEDVAYIINSLKINELKIIQNAVVVFKHKKEIPLKQLYALYAINKIASITNRK